MRHRRSRRKTRRNGGAGQEPHGTTSAIYVVIEVSDDVGGWSVWDTAYSTQESAVTAIRAKVDAAGNDEDGNPIGQMERELKDEEGRGLLVANLHDYDVQFYVKKVVVSA